MLVQIHQTHVFRMTAAVIPMGLTAAATRASRGCVLCPVLASVVGGLPGSPRDCWMRLCMLVWLKSRLTRLPRFARALNATAVTAVSLNESLVSCDMAAMRKRPESLMSV